MPSQIDGAVGGAESGVKAPLVSILITTYNRSTLLRRAIQSVLIQDFADYEIVVIDDCSPDDTTEVVASIGDPRIRYIRNETNVGSKLGDRVILRRFIYDLMKGKYWVYLCDDDYWLYPDLLSRQVKAFNTYDDVVMVMGGQLSYFLTTPESYFGHSPDRTKTFTLDNLKAYFDFDTLTPKTPHLYFMKAHGQTEPLFSKTCMTSDEYLIEFAGDPAGKNIIGGAMLYSREHFIRSGALLSEDGSQWQAGYELKMGPACYGKTVYFDEPSILTEIRPANASFQRTQVDHYLDSVKSIEIAFQTPLSDPALAKRRPFLRGIHNETIRNLSKVFLANALSILRDGQLGMCSPENMRHHLRIWPVFRVAAKNRMYPGSAVLFYGSVVEIERLSGGRILRLIAFSRRARAGLARRINAIVRSPRLALELVTRLGWFILHMIWSFIPPAARKVIRPWFSARG